MTTLLIKSDFWLSKLTILHEFGHMFGCSHEKSDSKFMKSPVYMGYPFRLTNGICSLMYSPSERNCTSRGLFYSNPHFYVDNGSSLGTSRQNNAEWIKHNRFAVQNVGNETHVCSNRFLNQTMVDCFLRSKYVRTSCDDIVLNDQRVI